MARTTIRTEDITAGEVTTAKMATDPTNASNLSSGSVPLAQLGNAPTVSDVTSLEDDIAILGFKVAANGSLAKYNLVDQVIDTFEDTSGINGSLSANEIITSNYVWGSVTVTPTATGGTITTDGDYKVHSFSADGTFVTDTTQNMAIFLVGGGGAGNGRVGPGGGGGGVVYVTSYSVSAASHAVVVGEGGATSADDANVNPGEDTTFASAITANGGGGGATAGQEGGSAGGSKSSTVASSNQSSENAGISNLTQYGNAGGEGIGAPNYNNGGGGGAGAVGGNSSPSALGNGGDGVANSITGSSVVYGGGGGGGQHGYTDTAAMTAAGGQGGTGGGGSVPGYANPTDGGPGTDGLGGGGAGAQGYGSGGTGGAGGDGILIIRRKTSDAGPGALTLISTSTTAESTPTNGDMVMSYTNGAGTATINTDVKGYISRDNGTTYTQGTLVSLGTSGGHEITSFHNLDISSQPSGVTMLYKITTHNQSSSKETRIQAVSLGWS